MKDKNTYWSDVAVTIGSVYTGLRLTLSHVLKARKSRIPVAISETNYFKLQEGISTIQYPHETIPVPDNGRYQLHNEIEDCIVCDKCAKVCPVDCIDIVPIKSPEEIGKTSDGTPKRIYAAKFDIDMAKCCFCGLCTTVCPTECLTMTKKYDFSVFDVRDHNFVFGEMSETQIKEKKENWEEYQKAKAAAALPASNEDKKDSTPGAPAVPATGAKPVFRPKVIAKPAVPPTVTEAKEEEKAEVKEDLAITPPPAPVKPVFRPKMMKPVVPSIVPAVEEKKESEEKNSGEEPPPTPPES